MSVPPIVSPLKKGDRIRLGFHRGKDRGPVHLPKEPLMVNEVGGTGTGKTTLMENAALGYLRTTDDTVVFFDFHGSATPSILARITPEEARKTLVIRPSRLMKDGKVALGMNLLRIENKDALEPNDLINAYTVVEGDVAQIVAAKEGSQEMGGRIRRHLGMVVRGLLHMDKETTLYDAFLVVEGFKKTPERGEFSRQTRNVDARKYGEATLVNLDSITLQSTQNKVQYFSHPFFRAAFCQRGEGVVTMHSLLQRYQFILIDLEAQTLPQDLARYLGSAYLTSCWLAALRHGDEKSEKYDRTRHLRIFVDEWPEMASESFATILRGGRKRGVRLWLATQSLRDVPDGQHGKMDLLSPLRSNVSTWFCFRTDEFSAKIMDERAQLRRWGLDYHHYLNWPDYNVGMAQGINYIDLEIDPKGPEQPPEVQAEVARIVEANIWSHAKVDNSEDSPLRIGKKDELDVLEIFYRHGAMSRDQAILHAPDQHRSKVWTIVRNLENYGFLISHTDTPKGKEKYQIVELGIRELRKYGRIPPDGTPVSGKKMDGGDSHDTTLERARAHLQAQGRQVGPKITQVVGKSNPDFTHTTEDGILVFDEVEDRASHPDQILKNYQKAQGKPVWFWAVDLDTARRIVDTLGEQPNYQVYVDQVTSFSRFGPGVPKEEEPISEEQELVEHAIISLIEEGRCITVDGCRGFAFKDIVQSLSKPLPYQKVRSVLERMVGDTIYAIQERRPEQGGPLVILNDIPEEERTKTSATVPEPRDANPHPEKPSSDDDVEMVIDTCIALAEAGKTFLHNDRGMRTSFRVSEVYDALPRRISLARFKEVLATLLEQDEVSEVVLRPGKTAILVADPPDTGNVDHRRVLEATTEELYHGLQPVAAALEKAPPKTTPPPSKPCRSQTSAPPPSSPSGQTKGTEMPPLPDRREGIWEISLRMARDKWPKRQKSFLTEDGKHVAVKFDTLFGLVKTVLVRGGQGTPFTPELLVRALKEHGVEVESRAPPSHWTQTWHERFCLFPLAVLQGKTEKAGSAPDPSPPPTPPTPPQAVGPDHMVQILKAQANQLQAQGKVLDINGRKAVRVSDICAFYAPWNEAEMATYLGLHHLPTERIWIQTKKRRVRIWFAWD